ncbi:MAG: hypothetical protein A4E45_01689 [Methanosaeta sp. PtaB.Bin039]|nr:MAG: hypothetical protein A4E45_01689 [Methanosaeta sp. PtaB.Bin039]
MQYTGANPAARQKGNEVCGAMPMSLFVLMHFMLIIKYQFYIIL